MNINTKFNTGEKVWYYIKEKNSYTWGKVISIDIEVRLGKGYVFYKVENRFYDKDTLFIYIPLYREPSFESQSIISFNEEQVFSTPEEIRTYLEQKHFEKMSELKELKKGFFK